MEQNRFMVLLTLNVLAITFINDEWSKQKNELEPAN